MPTSHHDAAFGNGVNSAPLPSNPMTDTESRGLIAAATSPEIDVILAVKPVQLRFTHVRIDDIRTISEI